MSSLQEWLADQREQLAADRTEVLPVPGYEKRLAGRYRLVEYSKADEISQKNLTPLERAADLLCWSCVELLEITGEDEYQVTGAKWDLAGVRKLFPHLDLPEDATTRQAILAAFPPPAGEYRLMLHIEQIDLALATAAKEIGEEIRGNSDARSAETEPSISQ